jgi:hypothetical protein
VLTRHILTGMAAVIVVALGPAASGRARTEAL